MSSHKKKDVNETNPRISLVHSKKKKYYVNIEVNKVNIHHVVII